MAGGAVPPTHRAQVRPGGGAQHSVTAGLDTAASDTDVVSVQTARRPVHHRAGQQVVGTGVLHLAVQAASVARHQLGSPPDGGGEVRDVVSDSVVGLALLVPEVLAPGAGLSTAGLVIHTVTRAVQSSVTWRGTVALSH